ncbi:MAG TPA: hypothetical protein VG245_10960, partial [Candidatus Dormibacteraeota bacterium]|nr:hypothetical protein [Candidatus Dormibacteraeota bacterium]
QYLAATLGAGALLAVLFFNTGNLWLLLVQTGIHPLLRLLVLVLSELLELGLLISMISFWIAAWWDAKQGTLALNAAHPHRPTWWFVKVKRFLFDDPDVEGSDV